MGFDKNFSIFREIVNFVSHWKVLNVSAEMPKGVSAPPESRSNNYGVPEGFKCELTTFLLWICDGYNRLAVQKFSLLCKTGVR